MKYSLPYLIIKINSRKYFEFLRNNNLPNLLIFPNDAEMEFLGYYISKVILLEREKKNLLIYYF